MSDEESTNTEERKQDNERTFTQADMDRLVEKRLKSLKQELEARPTIDEVDELKSKLDEIAQEKAMAGKNAMEKIEHQHSRELEKLAKQSAMLEEQLKEKEALATATEARLQNYRLESAFGSALNKAGVYAPGAGDALRVLLAEIKEPEIGDTGVRATYGDEIDEPPDVIAKKFLEDRPHFASARVGGSGTLPPNGTPRIKNLDDMGVDELWAAAGPDPSAKDSQH